MRFYFLDLHLEWQSWNYAKYTTNKIDSHHIWPLLVRNKNELAREFRFSTFLILSHYSTHNLQSKHWWEFSFSLFLIISYQIPQTNHTLNEWILPKYKAGLTIIPKKTHININHKHIERTIKVSDMGLFEIWLVEYDGEKKAKPPTNINSSKQVKGDKY